MARANGPGAWAFTALTILVGATAAAPLAGQGLAPGTPGLTGGRVGRIHIEELPGTPAVGMALALPVGSADDPDGLEGSARVMAGTIRRRVESALGPGGGTVAVSVTPHLTLIRLAVLPESWQVAWRALTAAAFEDTPAAPDVAAVVANLQEVLTFEAGAPIVDVRNQTRALLYGAASPAARPTDGTLESVGRIDAGALDGFRRRTYRADDASLSVLGALGGEDAARRVLGLPPAPLPAIVDSLVATPDTAAADSMGAAASAGADSVAGAPPAPSPDSAATGVPPAPDTAYVGALPWDQGDRIRVVQEVTNTWITVAYPVPSDMPATLLEFLSRRLTEDFNPSPPDPGVFNVQVDVRTLDSGRALVVEAAVLPDAADRWEQRILDGVEALAIPAEDAFFRWQRRRFRSAELLREAVPEQAAARRAQDLVRDGEVRALRAAVWTLGPSELARAASALGPPRILVYGPDLGGG